MVASDLDPRARRRRGRARAILAAGAAMFVAGALAPAPAPARNADGGLADADYWRAADAIVAELDSRWNESRGLYVGDGAAASARFNSSLLLVHAVAALEGREGAVRRDARARRLVRAFTSAPAWRGPARTAVNHPALCWSTDVDRQRIGDKTLESKVAEALVWAWRARRVLAIGRATARSIQRTVARCATWRTWRFPAQKANQFNFNAELYAAAATVAGRRDLLRRDYAQHLAGFAATIARPPRRERAANLGPGYSFRYRHDLSPRAPINIDSAEYANIVVHAIAWYERALRAGMRPLPARSMGLMRAWTTRVLSGYWTHAGYLNWDTGHGRKRWHSGQFWAFAQQGLLAIATAPRFWDRPEQGRWAKALFDRGIELYPRLAAEERARLVPGKLFGVTGGYDDVLLLGARMAANAARAVGHGLGDLPASEPPPLYAFDHDSGRLAVSTAAYSTAIAATDRGAYGYGGLDPARLLGARGLPVANVGGGPPGSFGVQVTAADGSEQLASQRPLRARRGRQPLRLVRSPRGDLRRPRDYPRKPYAGPFRRLEARGRVSARRLAVDAVHRFDATAITSRWTVRSTRAEPLRVRAHFPTANGAAIDVVRRDGRTLRLAGPDAAPAGTRVALAEVDHVRLGTAQRGYRLEPVAGPQGAELVALAGRPQPTNPRPGATLAYELGRAAPLRETAVAVRIVPFG